MFPIDKFQSLHTPLYYYDIALLRNTLETVVTESGKYPNYHVHYAIKANHDPKLLSLIAKYGLGADCVSGGEIIDAIQAGIPCHKIVYAGVGKSDSEITLALKHEIGCFNVESLAELRVINELAEKMNCQAKVAFRVNPDVDAHTHEKITTGLSENKFGISLAHLSQAIEEAHQLKAIELVGLHFHIGSQIEQMHVFETLCERINSIVSELVDKGVTLKSINVGGGL
jgi:diaminopimelate decarboxylase